MKVKVHFFGTFRNMADRAEQIIELPEASTVRDLLDYLKEQYSKMTSLLSGGKGETSRVLVTRNVKPVQNYEDNLEENDQLYLFIFLSGG